MGRASLDYGVFLRKYLIKFKVAHEI
jgi:hypothetical protein